MLSGRSPAISAPSDMRQCPFVRDSAPDSRRLRVSSATKNGLPSVLASSARTSPSSAVSAAPSPIALTSSTMSEDRRPVRSKRSACGSRCMSARSWRNG